jgi:hypothetical protein
LKLILNSLLSCSAMAVPQWYIVDNPKSAGLSPRLTDCCPFAQPSDVNARPRHEDRTWTRCTSMVTTSLPRDRRATGLKGL